MPALQERLVTGHDLVSIDLPHACTRARFVTEPVRRVLSSECRVEFLWRVELVLCGGVRPDEETDCVSYTELLLCQRTPWLDVFRRNTFSGEDYVDGERERGDAVCGIGLLEGSTCCMVDVPGRRAEIASAWSTVLVSGRDARFVCEQDGEVARQMECSLSIVLRNRCCRSLSLSGRHSGTLHRAEAHVLALTSNPGKQRAQGSGSVCRDFRFVGRRTKPKGCRSLTKPRVWR